jgi:hypothetical protein
MVWECSSMVTCWLQSSVPQKEKLTIALRKSNSIDTCTDIKLIIFSLNLPIFSFLFGPFIDMS